MEAGCGHKDGREHRVHHHEQPLRGPHHSEPRPMPRHLRQDQMEQDPEDQVHTQERLHHLLQAGRLEENCSMDSQS